MIRTVIVEDDQKSARILQNHLKSNCPTLNIRGVAESVSEAIDLIKKEEPELVFLDIELKEGTAFDILNQLDSISFEIIFQTAFNNYAMEAINFSASAYILKPIDLDELVSAVSRSIENIKEKTDNIHARVILENMLTTQKQDKKIVLPVMDGFEVISIKEIIRCKAMDNLTELFTLDKSKKTVCRTLKFFEETLNDFGFIRTHKSHLINLQYVKQYKKGKGGEITMLDGSVVDLSPGKKKLFLDTFVK